jgi:hypothetical protein
MGIENVLFTIILATGAGLFTWNVRKIIRNIQLGKKLDRTDQPAKRWKIMAKVALGQSKMLVRPIPAILHLFVYIGFVIINIEVLEILLDGIFGTHRLFAFLGGFYDFLIASFEILALLVLIGVVAFFIRRNVIYIKRFRQNELNGWPRSDANIILGIEVLLMSAFLIMNASDTILASRNIGHYVTAGSFPVSGFLVPMFDSLSNESLVFLERFTWWFHILGILAFLN